MVGWNAFRRCLVVEAVFALPECVRAALGTTGRAEQWEFIQASSSVVRWGLGPGSSPTEAKGHWVQGLDDFMPLPTVPHSLPV